MTMSGELDTTYFDYLESQIGMRRNSGSYRDLLNILFAKDFVWLVPNDDNRIADGLDIRAEWFDTIVVIGEDRCSFLEVLIGLSRRMAFITDESAEGWSWQLIINLGLDKMRDDLSTYKTRKANDILDTAIWRNYSPDGSGGFFPLLRPKNDQRETELWYQMNAYIEEIKT